MNKYQTMSNSTLDAWLKLWETSSLVRIIDSINQYALACWEKYNRTHDQSILMKLEYFKTNPNSTLEEYITCGKTAD